nr:unnamed protein product [Callosobruchus analis]
MDKWIRIVISCAAFKLALRAHDEISASHNPNIYIGLVNFTAETDALLVIQVFKGKSKTNQNELLRRCNVGNLPAEHIHVLILLPSSFSTFFTRATNRTAILDEVLKRRLLRATPTRWNFKSRTVYTLFERMYSFKECLDKTMEEDRLDSVSVSEASGLLKRLNCPDFLYWLKIFHFIMPHVEILFN